MVRKNIEICDICKDKVAVQKCFCCKRDTCKTCHGKMGLSLNVITKEPEDYDRSLVRSAMSITPPKKTSIFNPFQSSPRIYPYDDTLISKRNPLITDIIKFPICIECIDKIKKGKQKDISPEAIQKLTEVLGQSFKELMFLNQL